MAARRFAGNLPLGGVRGLDSNFLLPPRTALSRLAKFAEAPLPLGSRASVAIVAAEDQPISPRQAPAGFPPAKQPARLLAGWTSACRLGDYPTTQLQPRSCGAMLCWGKIER
jgi:hypothetical protein